MSFNASIISTYRIQFSPMFTFRSARDIVNYLEDLGISHLYASPILDAVPGSVHGYDVIDFARIREEIGGEEQFRELHSRLRNHSIGWIQDFVPNHMALHQLNPYLYDVLRFGTASKYARLFDIDWDHPGEGKGKLMLPILSNPYQQELEDEKFIFSDHNNPSIQYGELTLPLGKPFSTVSTPDNAEWSRDEDLETLLSKATKDPLIADSILSQQHYHLRYWKSSRSEINYRRFFAVNSLICLREEDEFTFNEVHWKLLDLIKENMFDGLRLDHIDGLYDPENYLFKLRKFIGNTYIVVEKILQQDELIPPDWEVEGTTGYDFLSHVNAVFCSERGLSELDRVYQEFIEIDESGKNSAHEIKKQVMDGLFQGDLDNITGQIWNYLTQSDLVSKIKRERLSEAIKEVLAGITVYRTYIGLHNHPDDTSPLISAIGIANERRADLAAELNSLRSLIEKCAGNQKAIEAIRHFQQFMPAVFAKSVEDRIFFVSNRLISLNEVGSDPHIAKTSIEDFHQFNTERAKNSPLSLNALSTHDTKLSEDIRARINVISEVPLEWEKRIRAWAEINSVLHKLSGKKDSPSANEEYYIYQLLLGSYPFSGEEAEGYQERLIQHLLKSIREASANTCWDDPDLSYEKCYREFIVDLLDREKNKQFWASFLEFGKTVSFHGGLNSLGQKILQLTLPGVPDSYQGTEIWNYSFVDPDNRRRVDFSRIARMHHMIKNNETGFDGLIDAYPEDLSSGYLKLLVVSKLLNLRKLHPDLFSDGSYIPLEVTGEHRENLIAFLREKNDSIVLVAVTRLTTKLGIGRTPKGEETWRDTVIKIPPKCRIVFQDLFTQRTLDLAGKEQIRASTIFEKSPFSVLVHSTGMER